MALSSAAKSVYTALAGALHWRSQRGASPAANKKKYQDKSSLVNLTVNMRYKNKKLSYCWETVRRESIPRIAEMDVEMTT